MRDIGDVNQACHRSRLPTAETVTSCSSVRPERVFSGKSSGCSAWVSRLDTPESRAAAIADASRPEVDAGKNLGQ